MNQNEAEKPGSVVTQITSFKDVAALRKGNFVPTATVEEMLEWGGIGLGTLMDDRGVVVGEVTVIDGEAFGTFKDGRTRPLKKDEVIYFGQVTHHDAPITTDISAINREELEAQLMALLKRSEMDPSAFVIKLSGQFDEVTLRSVDGGERTFESLADIVGAQAILLTQPGTQFDLAGIYSAPGHLSAEETPSGLHMHALATERNTGGHVLDFTGFTGTVEITPVAQWRVTTCERAEGARIFRPAVTAAGRTA